MANRLTPTAAELAQLLDPPSDSAIHPTPLRPVSGSAYSTPTPSEQAARPELVTRVATQMAGSSATRDVSFGGQTSYSTGDLAIGLYEIDAAIIYYWLQVIKPQVSKPGSSTVIDVPLVWGNPERWQAMQVEGYIRDNRGNLILPLVMFRRTSIARDDNMIIDDIHRNEVIPLENKFTPTYKYNNFSVTNELTSSAQIVHTSISEFITLNYECVIWTEFTEQMNPIIEKVIQHERKFWGKPDRFRFRAQVDNWEDASELTAGGDRVIKTNFSLAFNGYLIPETIEGQISTGATRYFDRVTGPLATSSFSRWSGSESDGTTGKSKIIEEVHPLIGDPNYAEDIGH